MIDFVVHDEGDSVGVVVVEGVRAGAELTGWIMDQDRDITFTAASDIRSATSLQSSRCRPENGDQVRRRYRQGSGGHRPRRARARAQHQDQTLVGGDPMAMDLANSDVPRLPPRERPDRRTQSRDHPSRRRPFERGVRSGREQHQGRDGDPAPLRPAAVRRGPRPALQDTDWNRIEPQRRGGRGDRHRGRMDAARGGRHRRDRKAGHRYGIELHGDHETILRASRTAREYVQWASELVREEAPLSDLWVSTKCGESDTTSGCGSNPHRGQRVRQALPPRHDPALRRNHRDHGR